MSFSLKKMSLFFFFLSVTIHLYLLKIKSFFLQAVFTCRNTKQSLLWNKSLRRKKGHTCVILLPQPLSQWDSQAPFVDLGLSGKGLKVKVFQSCLTLGDPMDYTVQGILQARIPEWVAFPFSMEIFPTQGSTPGFLYCRRILYQLRHNGRPRILEWVAYPFSNGSSNPGIELGSPALQVVTLPAELLGKPIHHQ